MHWPNCIFRANLTTFSLQPHAVDVALPAAVATNLSHGVVSAQTSDDGRTVVVVRYVNVEAEPMTLDASIK